MKEIRYILTGSSREALNSVASTMHKAATGHEFVKGGKTKRPVTIQHESTNPKKIFDGIILPNNPA